MTPAARLRQGLEAHRAGQLDRAIDHYLSVLDCHPAHADALHLLGTARHQSGDHDAGAATIRQAIAHRDDNADYHNSLGVVLEAVGRLDDAAASYRRAIECDPGFAKAHYNLGSARQRLGDLADAAACFRKAIELRPDYAEAIDDLGTVMLHAGEPDKAVGCFRTALAVRPGFDRAYFNLLARAGEVCDWPMQATLLPELPSRLRRFVAGAVDPAPLLPLAFTLPYISDDHSCHIELLSALGTHYQRTRPDLTLATPDAADKLRIGYVSADFGDHPVSQVTRPVFERHDRSRFEIFAYAPKIRGGRDNPDVQPVINAVDHFVDLSADTTAAGARRIAADGIHILVDLGGYMRFARPELFALRPAPVQVYWQGHGGGLGAPYIDYVIGDHTVTPPAHDDRYVERIVRLPDCWTSADHPPLPGDIGSRADHDLPDGAVVLCAFNNVLKIEATVFAAWMDILRAVPDAVLWLNPGGKPIARERLADAAAAAGIDPARLVFADRVPAKADHLARHRHADLFLDTFHYNASVTALDALWTGLPVLTRIGDAFSSRIGASYLRAIGLPELICETTAAYRDLAIDLARDPERRAALKSRLAANRETAPLFDCDRFTARLEAAFETMWRQRTSA